MYQLKVADLLLIFNHIVGQKSEDSLARPCALGSLIDSKKDVSWSFGLIWRLNWTKASFQTHSLSLLRADGLIDLVPHYLLLPEVSCQVSLPRLFYQSKLVRWTKEISFVYFCFYFHCSSRWVKKDLAEIYFRVFCLSMFSSKTL